MDEINVRSVYGNNLVIRKVERERSSEFKDFFEIVIDNKRGYVLNLDEIRKIKEFFISFDE